MIKGAISPASVQTMNLRGGSSKGPVSHYSNSIEDVLHNEEEKEYRQAQDKTASYLNLQDNVNVNDNQWKIIPPSSFEM